MQEVFLGSSQSISVPATATNILIVHDWNAITVNFATVTGGGTYNWTPESIGAHRIFFVNTMTQNTLVSPPQPAYLNYPQIRVVGNALTSVNTFLNPAPDYVTDTTTQTQVTNQLQAVVTNAIVVGAVQVFKASIPLVQIGDFLTDFPTVDPSIFAGKERKIRNLVENYTQQAFGPFLNKTLMIEGNGGNNLSLYRPIRYLNTLTNQYGVDLTTDVTISTESPYFLDHISFLVYSDHSTIDYGYVDRRKDIKTRYNDFFDRFMKFFVTGDFGYYYVPDDVTQAAKLLIADDYSGANNFRLQGIKQAQLGDYSYTLDTINGTTGNLYADNLLSAYVNWNIGLA